MIVPVLQRELSIDDFVDGREGRRLGSFLADPNAEDPVQRLHAIEVMRMVWRAVVTLDDRERYIIRCRFGLLGGEEQTLEEIGSAMGLSRERVRQLERTAKDKLRLQLDLRRAYLD